MNGLVEAGYQYDASNELAAAVQRRLDITLRQNLDEQIAKADAHAAYLRETKARMEASGILDMRIEDLSTAMRF